MSENNDKNDNKIVFKKRNRFGQRRRQLSEDSEEVEDNVQQSDDWIKLNELKQIQNQRKRSTKGINILELTENPIHNNINENKTKNVGISDTKTNELDLGNTFSVETNRRDEDTDLMKYIEEELHKRKGMQSSTTPTFDPKKQLVVNPVVNASNDMNNLFDVLPEHLITNNAKKSEEMLSNQMLNGIPEIDLGLEEKIRNIEATEEAKTVLYDNKRNKMNSKSSSFVPNNIAVCFVQHNRYNINEDIPRLDISVKRMRTEPQPPTNTYVEEPVVVIGDEPKQMPKLQNKGWDPNQNKFMGKDKASDDYMFEKFKKQFRKF